MSPISVVTNFESLLKFVQILSLMDWYCKCKVRKGLTHKDSRSVGREFSKSGIEVMMTFFINWKGILFRKLFFWNVSLCLLFTVLGCKVYRGGCDL